MLVQVGLAMFEAVNERLAELRAKRRAADSRGVAPPAPPGDAAASEETEETEETEEAEAEEAAEEEEAEGVA